MTSYIIQFFINEDKQATEQWETNDWRRLYGKFKWKQIKGWDRHSPLFAASSGKRPYISCDFSKAKHFSTIAEANQFINHVVGCGSMYEYKLIYDYPIIGAQIIKVDVRPIQRTDVPTELIKSHEPLNPHR